MTRRSLPPLKPKPLCFKKGQEEVMSALLSSAVQKAQTLQEGIQDELVEQSIEGYRK
jgi:hypothetical protein